MIHTFQLNGLYFLLDVDSGAVHMVDELAYDVVRLYETHDQKAIIQALDGRHLAVDIEEVLAEFHQLKAEGALFTKNDHAVSAPDAWQTGELKAMCLHAAHDCNLRCEYCFASTGDFCGPRGLLPLETGKKALEYLVRRSGGRKILEVDFFGGEPLMNFPVVKQLVAYGRELEKKHGKTFRFTMTTNGIGLTDEVIAYLNEEMSNVVISIDGRKEVHDRMRPTIAKTGSYDVILPKALKCIEAREQQNYYVRGTFTSRNLDFASDVLSLHDAGFEQISIEPVVADADAPYALSYEHLPAILAEYEVLAQKVLERRKTGHFINYFHFMVDLDGGPCIRKRLSGCGAGNEYIAVTPEGDVYPCHQFVGREGFKMGSVLDDSFDGDMQGRFAQNHVLNKPACRECWAKYYCTGGCAANAHKFHGDFAKPYDLECQMERKRLECGMMIWACERTEA